jgi:hypothetical protein
VEDRGIEQMAVTGSAGSGNRIWEDQEQHISRHACAAAGWRPASPFSLRVPFPTATMHHSQALDPDPSNPDPPSRLFLGALLSFLKLPFDDEALPFLGPLCLVGPPTAPGHAGGT